ncbi:tape measure protein [Citrobacter freundii]|uniref:tape measure protein n=1 Tax=Citrobacter freundii TaxID=546 RepID=UPI0024E14DA0|nr:tape measure protein [Citrobacter freundii]WOR42043.1 tape measure protein [Citrobacter freundii]
MTDQSADLVTKIDVIPDLEGLNTFDAAIDKAIAKVNQLDAAIKRVNNLKPASPYAPSGASAMPTAATATAVAAIAASGANLVSRTPLADTVRKEAQKVARAAVEGTSAGISGLLPPPQRLLSGGGLMIPPSTGLLSGGGGGGMLPPQGRGGINVPPPSGNGLSAIAAGRGGRLMDPDAGNPLSKYDTSAKSFSKTPLTPTVEAVKNATGGGGFKFGLDNVLAGAGLTAGIVAASNAMAESLDTIQRQQAQLERLKQTTGDAKDAFFELNRAASDMRSDSGSFISTYTNMATATEKLGFSQERTIKATQGLVGALQLGGGSEEAKNAALYQMGQAFSSDRFGGDEFRSFMEAIGTQAPKVAEAFGTDVKGLRAMSEAGKLTAETMFKAFEKMATSNADLLKKQGWTWGQVTTVMKNDWQAFLAQATIGGEWQKFTDWAANTLIPIARSAEKEIAEFWSTLADESKSAILIGILGAVGAAFTALAIPVLAALWPFLAIGAAVWVVYEAFVEWKAWLDGEGGTIFDSIFGSFDEFERRYPNLVSGLRKLIDLSSKVATGIDNATKGDGSNGVISDAIENPLTTVFHGLYNLTPLSNTMRSISGVADLFDLNPLPGIDSAMGMFSSSQNKGQNITNSGNTTTTVVVSSPKEAADTVNNINEPGAITNDFGGNIAESTGAQ